VIYILVSQLSGRAAFCRSRKIYVRNFDFSKEVYKTAISLQFCFLYEIFI